MGKGTYAGAGLRHPDTPGRGVLATLHPDTYMNANKKLHDMDYTYLIESAPGYQAASLPGVRAKGDER